MYFTPKTDYVYIMGTRFHIVLDDHRLDLEDADGLFDGDTIYLRTQYDNVKEYLRVYRHECFHALCEVLGVQLDHNLEEILAHRVSTMYTFEV